LMEALDKEYSHAFMYHYPELLRESKTPSSDAANAAELGGPKRKAATESAACAQPVISQFQKTWR
jgi:hypothetical protein